MRLDFIDINVRVPPDAMEAFLVFEPLEGAGVLTADILNTALEQAGVVRGVSKSALSSAADSYNKNPRPFETGAVAVGEIGTAENSGPVRMQVKYLSEPADVERVRNRTSYWEIADLAGKFQRVDNGTVVARRTGGAAGLLGYTVRGEPVSPPTNDADAAGGINEHNHVFRAGDVFSAAATGVVYLDELGMPGVFPINFDGGLELDITPDGMEAMLTVHPAGERGDMPDEAAIRELMKQKGIVAGIDETDLGHFLIQIRKGIAASVSHVVAHGIKSVKGNDGMVNFCFNVESSPTPTLNPDGSADYKNVDLVTSVGTGTVLAKLTPPREGMPGMDIFGRTLPAVNGAPAVLPAGPNTVIPKTDPTILVADAEGIPTYNGAVVSVSKGYIIGGDVDYSTGNVDYGHSVEIKGDIKSGFSVTCGGDLQVGGAIEDCAVNVGGNVLCKCGFVGGGKGVITAHGDVNLTYCNNQTIVSHGNVNIAKEALNCNIKAYKSINVYGQRLSAAGGILSAVETIVLKTVGTISGVHTILQIEPDPVLVEEMTNLKTTVEQQGVTLKKIAHTINNLPPDKRSDAAFMRKLKNTAVAIKDQIGAAEMRMTEINISINNFEHSFIHVDRLTYPGTEFRFGKYSLMVHEPLSGGKTIRVIDCEIKVM